MSVIPDDELAQMIAAWRAGMLSPREQQAWAKRLADDPAAHQEFNAQVRISAAIEIAYGSMPGSATKSIWQVLERHVFGSASGAQRMLRTVKAVDTRLARRRWRMPAWSAAAALLALSLTAWWAFRANGDQTTFWLMGDQPVAEATEVLGGPGGVSLHATDGSTVLISSGTIAVVSRDQIEVRLGEVRAHLAPRSNGVPFAITTRQARTLVLGTALSVVAGRRDTVVEVETGQVRVTTAIDTLVVNAGESVIASSIADDAGTLRLTTPRPMGVMEPAAVLADTVGVNVHLALGLSPYDRFDELVLPRLRELGIRHVRDGFAGRMPELAPRLRSAGISLTAIVEETEDVSGLADRLAAIVGSLDAVEAPRASDTRTDGQYASPVFYRGAGFPAGTVAFTRDLVNELRARPATANLPIIAPSVGDPSRISELGTIPHLDFANVDAIAGVLFPQAAFAASNPGAARVVAGGQLPVVSAIGWHTDTTTGDRLGRAGVDESTQARHVLALALCVSQLPARRAFVYQLCDAGPTLIAEGENAYGILRTDGTPKPAFRALARLMSLADSSHTSAATPSEEPALRVHADAAVYVRLLACADGRRLVALWSDRVTGIAVLVLPPHVLGPHPWRIRCHQPVSGAVRDFDPANLITLPDPMDPVIVELIPAP